MLSFLGFIFMCGYVGNTFPPPLSVCEEQQLIERMNNGDISARNKLIECNLRLVAHIVKKYTRNNEDTDEFISIGTIGLIKAISTFNSDKSKLATYAGKCIENEILMYLRSEKKRRSDVSLQSSIGVDKEGNEVTLEEKLADSSPGTEEHLEFESDCRQLKQLVSSILTPQEKYIIEKRYGLNNQKETTQREIAKELSISRSYVSRIEKRAIDKLKAKINNFFI